MQTSDDIVPIESLYYDDAGPHVLAAPRRPTPGGAGAEGAAGAEGRGDLAASWSRYERWIAELGLAEPSLDELLGVTLIGAPAAPAAPPTFATAPTALTAGGEEGEQGVVPIADLCYGGRAALEQALRLREELRQALAHRPADTTHLTDLIEELFDLVELGLQDQR